MTRHACAAITTCTSSESQQGFLYVQACCGRGYLYRRNILILDTAITRSSALSLLKGGVFLNFYFINDRFTFMPFIPHLIPPLSHGFYIDVGVARPKARLRRRLSGKRLKEARKFISLTNPCCLLGGEGGGGAYIGRSYILLCIAGLSISSDKFPKFEGFPN